MSKMQKCKFCTVDRVFRPVCARKGLVCIKQVKHGDTIQVQGLGLLKHRARICMAKCSFGWPLLRFLSLILQVNLAFELWPGHKAVHCIHRINPVQFQILVTVQFCRWAVSQAASSACKTAQKSNKNVPSCRDITLTFASGSILSIIALDIACNERNSTSLGQKPSCIVMHFMHKNVHYANYAIYIIKRKNLKISLTLENGERSIAVSSMEDVLEVQ